MLRDNGAQMAVFGAIRSKSIAENLAGEWWALVDDLRTLGFQAHAVHALKVEWWQPRTRAAVRYTTSTLAE